VKKTRISIIRIGVLFLIAIALYVLGLYVAVPSYFLASSSSTVATALRDAQSVTVSELVPYFDTASDELIERERILHTVTASPVQISRFRSATSGFLDAGSPLAHKRCFTPHHRVEIVRTDGSVSRFDVCFLCNNFRFDGPVIHTIPSGWRSRLERFSTDLGMPPRTSDEYAKLGPKSA
jgi:hypothetical protein